MSEYYIKQPGTDHTRGPLNLEQLVSLAETGSVSEDTLLYDEFSEKWKPISSYPDLLPAIFPERKKLSLNRIEPAPTADDVASEIAEGKIKPKVSTETILKEAAGGTAATRHAVRVQQSMDKAASLAVPGLGTLLAVSAVALIFPAKNLVIDAISSESALYMVFLNPVIIIGLVYAALSAGVFLGMTSLFTWVRFIAGISIGMLAYLFWAWENPFLMDCAILMGGGIFGTSISTRYFWMVISLAIGFIGAVSIAYFAITGVIVYP